MTIEELMTKVKTYLSPDDVQFIERAYQFARDAHEGQYRQSGEEYINHPVEVAGILANLQLDAVTIAAALLHDVIEDTTATVEELEEQFGEEVALLVNGVTKLKRIKYKSQEEQQAENHRRMFVAMAKDLRVILIKLADRLHNMRTLKYMPEEKRRKKAEETLEIFAPLAHRLGISTIKWELEDISLRYLNPQQYYRIVHLMKQKRAEREQHIQKVIEIIRQKIEEVGIKAEISGRPKHIYSIYRKMQEQKKAFNEIYDLMAIRIIVETVRDCYAVLGIIHTCWKPLPGRFKDYIAMPKPNMYQSLHTTVMSYKGQPLEVQIRTHEMHRTAEYGIAAHWAYKEGKNLKETSPSALDEKLTWFREVLESQQDAQDAREFMESLKMDLFSDVVFVFTPKGDVIELPAGSVPLDFAYRIHTEVGNRCVGAKVNGKIVPLDHELKTGDIVEILTSKHSYGPSRDWLKIAKSSTAKSKIKQFFKKEKREESIAKGKELVENEITKQGFDLKQVLTEENVDQVAKKFNFKGQEDMYAAVGYGGITASQIATRLTEKLRREQQLEKPVELPEVPQDKRRKKFAHGVRVKGVDNLLIRLSRCCNPVPGDEIIGFITKGRGVSVHRQDCPNVQREEVKERLLPVEWEGEPDYSYNVDIEITALDRRGLLNEVLQVVNESKTNIIAVSGRTDRNRMASISMTLAISNIDHLHKVVERIKQIRDIFSVQRVTQ
ncbi:(p)ppGpp synthetase I, SpoT/RelA [Caldalkalibacillus thermarum TA2.A1]|uniref:GTP pyrophosphokinase n=1 Tax=Caldalkalibacillus thermarum (strain TA2.A1) TaxID=986075 RepID=F5LAR7_CALTT|nr:bifunctional (p)ppGpp synthetase/guanosine-3',5'-bis(diphosphate) 3'-pyrophosphohydrolase [Caldalkalibacillus thermarum]EGL81639.1 (p)ppGpp synthetase I, SpoT/RelA [Caldalkalibacillus thermarum TA2.A1]QZT33476.1 bifunctional (p)ppGpp synthetase/guanosine-3',5'-bis(diphosphate) 3'-pyrophosphohydrolase [Caldalkalibacillus thermarum TA2.A1]